MAKFVVLSSILTNGKAVGQGTNPAFGFLEVFSGGVLSRKLAAENALRSAGFASWSVVRPGGLASKTPEELGAGGIYLSGEDTIFGESEEHGAAVSRDAVADELVAAAADYDAVVASVVQSANGHVLDVDALRAVARGVHTVRESRPDLGVLVISHYVRMLEELEADRVHLLIDGVIAAEGGPELGVELEAEGYDAWRS